MVFLPMSLKTKKGDAPGPERRSFSVRFGELAADRGGQQKAVGSATRSPSPEVVPEAPAQAKAPKRLPECTPELPGVDALVGGLGSASGSRSSSPESAAKADPPMIKGFGTQLRPKAMAKKP